mgnify:CR=1 FL=1
MPVRYRATLAYDGTAYQGFQRQAGAIPTIQGAVESAVAAVTGQVVTVTGAGRTDAGVHATGQVIAFDVDWQHGDQALLRAINAHLPGDIALQDICQQPGFHPRFDALARRYAYRVIVAPQRQPLLRWRAWQISQPLDSEQLAAGAARLTGRHDFGAFGQPPQGESTIREVYGSAWERRLTDAGTEWTYRIEANAFLQHMARRIVWLLVKLGRGALSLAEFEAVFLQAQLAKVKGMAPPYGLTLEAVRYPPEHTAATRWETSG